MNNLDEFDPFAPATDMPVFSPPVKVSPGYISEPLKEKLESSNINPYVNYKYINDVWNNPSHGIDINNEARLSLFFNDIEKSKDIWQESGVYLGFILQAVEKNTVIDMSNPFGLVPNIDNYDNVHHITTHEIKNIIDFYKEYLADEIVNKIDNINIEIKPFYAINKQEINYELVEQNYNKRLKIK